jgi:hypothetical protein
MSRRAASQASNSASGLDPGSLSDSNSDAWPKVGYREDDHPELPIVVRARTLNAHRDRR